MNPLWEDCFSGNGQTYRGKVNQAASGISCLGWDDTSSIFRFLCNIHLKLMIRSPYPHPPFPTNSVLIFLVQRWDLSSILVRSSFPHHWTLSTRRDSIWMLPAILCSIEFCFVTLTLNPLQELIKSQDLRGRACRNPINVTNLGRSSVIYAVFFFPIHLIPLVDVRKAPWCFIDVSKHSPSEICFLSS